MEEKKTAKVALAQAIIQVLWMKDFLSTEEREKMNEYCEKSVYKPVC